MDSDLNIQLGKEAVAVGLGLVPIYFVVNEVLPNSQQWMKLAVAGASFHLLCEYYGINNWYLNNSVASKKKYSDVYDDYYVRHHDFAERHRWRNHSYY